MSALPPKADIGTRSRNVRYVPIPDKVHCSKERRYSMSLFDHVVGTGELHRELFNVTLCRARVRRGRVATT